MKSFLLYILFITSSTAQVLGTGGTPGGGLSKKIGIDPAKCSKAIKTYVDDLYAFIKTDDKLIGLRKIPKDDLRSTVLLKSITEDSSSEINKEACKKDKKSWKIWKSKKSKFSNKESISETLASISLFCNDEEFEEFQAIEEYILRLRK